jgi:hypothetical protein
MNHLDVLRRSVDGSTKGEIIPAHLGDGESGAALFIIHHSKFIIDA